MMKTIEIIVIVDEAGDFGVGRDSDEARTSYTEAVGDIAEAEGMRTFILNLTVPVPEVVLATGSIPDDGGVVSLTVHAAETPTEETAA